MIFDKVWHDDHFLIEPDGVIRCGMMESFDKVGMMESFHKVWHDGVI